MIRSKKALTLIAVMLLAAATLPVFAAGKVNINTAGTDELARLPRIGAVIAQRIVDFRDENGEFSALEDLMLVRGIGEKTFELIEPYVMLDGETSLTEKVRASDAAAKAQSE